jgi:K+/H+ antiporter YhaU regulatory subunit KhtT
VTSVAAEVCGSDAAHAIRSVTNDQIPTVSSSGLFSVILAQAIRDQGMGQVFQQLMTYAGSEVCVRPALSSMVGKSFEVCARAASNAHVIGVIRHGRVLVLPEMDTVIEASDRMVFVEEELNCANRDRQVSLISFHPTISF